MIPRGNPDLDFLAAMTEVDENLSRRELSEIERAELIAKRVEIIQGKGAQVAQVSKGGRGKQGGSSATARDLNIPRDTVRRATQIAALAPEAKAEAKATDHTHLMAPLENVLGTIYLVVVYLLGRALRRLQNRLEAKVPVAVIIFPDTIPAIIAETTDQRLDAAVRALVGVPALPAGAEHVRSWIEALPAPSGWFKDADEAQAYASKPKPGDEDHPMLTTSIDGVTIN